MKRPKTCKHAKVQDIETFEVAKYANIQWRKLCQPEKAQILQTFKAAKDANI